MASKIINGKRVLVGSKADPLSSKFSKASGGKTVQRADGTYLSPTEAKNYGTSPSLPSPTPSGQQSFDYIARDGSKKSVQAMDADEAMRLATDIAPRSGVIQQTTTQLRNTFAKDSADLDNRLAIGGTQTPNGTVSITRDMDNGDGTRTVTYSDGTTARVSAIKNTDGSESYKEVGSGGENDPYAGLDEKTSSLTKQMDKQKKEAGRRLDAIASQMDAASAQLISGIKQLFAGRIDKMHEMNARTLRMKTTQGLREGRARYVQGVQQGILNDEEQSGLDRVDELQGQMLMAVAEAELARSKNKMSNFTAKMSEIRTIEDRMKTEIKALWATASAREKTMRDAEKAERDAEKDSLELSTKRAKASAPAVADSLDRLKGEAEQGAFLQAYADRTGIDMDVLLGEVNLARRAKNKDELDIRNINNQIYNRNRTTDIAEKKAGFNPSSGERALVGKYLAKNGTDVDTAKAEDDPDFFYYILNKAEEEEL